MLICGAMVSLEGFIDIILPAALRSTQPLTASEHQEYFLGGKGGRCVGLTALPPSCADCLEIWEPQTPGTLRACPCSYRDSFYLLYDAVRYTNNHARADVNTCRQLRDFLDCFLCVRFHCNADNVEGCYFLYCC